MVGTINRKTKGNVKKKPKDAQPTRKERANPFRGRKLSHPKIPLLSLTCKSWDLIIIGGLKQISLTHIVFLFVAKAKACWRAILTCYLKNWMQNKKDKWPFNHLLWKRQAHSLMKWSISHLCATWTSIIVGIKWCSSWNSLNFNNDIEFQNYTTNQLMTLITTLPCQVNNHLTRPSQKHDRLWCGGI